MAKGGRKIYRTSANSRKKRTRKAFKVFFVIILLAALVFLGYSIAKPIHNYILNKTGDNIVDEEVWTPPVVTEQNEEDSESETKTEETTQIDEEEKPLSSVKFSAYQLPVTALVSTDTLKAALNTAKGSGYTSVSVPLKEKGGKIYYTTASEMAAKSEDAVAGTMYAGQIASIIKSEGFTTIAYINLLEDNNRYGESRTGSYRIASDDSTWLDNAPSNGGKPWLSPFDEATQSYVEYLAYEVSTAGFDYVVFDGAVFPAFRNSDMNYIGDIVKTENRYKALVNIANIAAETVGLSETKAILNVSAAGIISGTEEVFKPAELNYEMFAVEYVPSELPAIALINGEEIALAELPANNKTQLIFSEIERLVGENVKIIPVFTQSDFSQADFNETITAVISLGCDSYIIK
ncbi:MAG: hypothetical protein IJZ61_04805 [Oscillospiraceae bacterium]|nr:hypothetical protein [Oscillospiraceae bacterium]